MVRGHRTGFFVVLLLVVLMTSLALLGGRTAQAAQSTPVQYKVVKTGKSTTSAAALQSLLDDNGKDGWVFIQYYGSTDGDVLIFRR